MKLTDMIIALPGLTAQERKALRLAIDACDEQDSDLDLEFIHAIENITKNRIALVPFKASKNYKVWMKHQPALEKVYRAIVGATPPHKIKRIALKQLLMQLLIDWLKSTRQEVTLPNICSQLVNIDMIVDMSFPGYLNNGMGFLIMKAIGGDK